MRKKTLRPPSSARRWKKRRAPFWLPCPRAALCVEGKQKTSEELAAYLDERAGSGAGDVAFVIGSSHGLADSVKQTASLRLSMSKMTFPHQLARVMLLEQLYRAFSINHGGKYHK